MTQTAEQTKDLPRPNPTQIRYLTPDMCTIHLGTHQALHVTIKNERIYGGVYAAYAFPVAHPDEYVSLIHTVKENKDIEIGVIRRLDEFPPAQVELIRAALRRRYFIHTITALKHITSLCNDFYLALDVETDKGPVNFMMRWQHDRAIDFGQHGKVLIDLDENRYLIPNVEAMPPKQRAAFRWYIYW